MSTVEIDSEVSPGILADNYSEVLGLQSSLGRSGPNLEIVPKLVKRILRDRCWREFLMPDGTVVKWNAADFREFLTSPRPKGCETPLEIVERTLRGTDAWEPFLEATRGERGCDSVLRGEGGRFESPYRNPITVRKDAPDITGVIPAVIPVPDVPSVTKPSRDYSREAPTGTSVSYAVRRLGKERPDLLERVKTGELKPKTAMREAGFVPDEFSIPVEPQSAARRILKRFEGEPLLELARVLANHAGYELRKKE